MISLRQDHTSNKHGWNRGTP